MPRLDQDADDMETHQIGGGNFNFTGARIANLGATEYTLATMFLDVTGSLDGHEAALRDTMVSVAQALLKSPRSDNLLYRAGTFSGRTIRELHGFKPLADIKIPDDYPQPVCYGATNLYDASYSAVGATNVYAEQLDAKDFLANAVTFVVTDGEDNVSTARPAMVAEEIKKAVHGEHLESHVTVLIGLSTSSASAAALKKFADEAKFTHFIDVGEVTKGKLAKLAGFVSRSVSSTSQALGTGGPSQQIAATF